MRRGGTHAADYSPLDGRWPDKPIKSGKIPPQLSFRFDSEDPANGGLFSLAAWRQVRLLRVSTQKRTGHPTGMLRAPYNGDPYSLVDGDG